MTSRAEQYRTVQVRMAERSIQTARAEIAKLDKQIKRLEQMRGEQERIIAENELIRDEIRPCDACGRRVASPCHTKGGMMENGPWDGHCRDVLYPERMP